MHPVKISTVLIIVLAALSGTTATARHRTPVKNDTLNVPLRALIVTGDAVKGADIVGVLYDASGRHHTEPVGPRFLFLDQQGHVALGIGGYLKGIAQYDFGGAITNGTNFTPYDISIGKVPGQQSRFYGSANNSSIFLQLVGRTSRWGYYQMYIGTNFTGNGATGYGLKLDQAYFKIGNLTAGLTNSVLVDGAVGTPVIDTKGPAGEISYKTFLLKYTPDITKNISAGIGVEYPNATYTVNSTVSSINQRVPDFPAYVQYQWNNGDSHVRLSGLIRALSYRDLVTSTNHLQLGWAAQLSGMVKIIPELTFLYQGAYGRGYAAFVNDISGQGLDLVPAETPGKMMAPRSTNYELGLQCDITPRLFMTACYSEARMYGIKYLGPDTYRYGRYVSISGFYDVIDDMRIGLEYLHGTRTDFSGAMGKANRVNVMLQYSF
ncbi:MAG: porin [Paramuribaculum sp.]|nr:porin [Paramuribaculum sp.]